MIKKITKNELKLGMYIHDLNCGWMNHSFFKKSFMLRKEADLKTILAAPNDDIYIDTLKGMDALSQPEGEDLGQPSGIEPILGRDRVVPPPDRTGFREERGLARQIKHEANVVIRALLTDVRMGRQVRPERLRPIVTRITDSILRNPGTLVSLCRIREADTCTFQHSVSVCALLVMFCHYLKLDGDIVREAGMGGLLHDIGKMRVPDHILNKPGKLSPAEFEVMKGHVALGLETLRQTPGISDLVLQVAGEHHERFTGGGYPNQRKGEEISPLGRMASIVDVYDALTSIRVYHKSIEPAEALRHLYQWSPDFFDEELVQHFIQAIGIYPVGSLVRLASGRLAVVIDQNEGGPLRPMVRVVYDLSRNRAMAPVDVDLSQVDPDGDGIITHEDPKAWNLDPDYFLNLEIDP